MTYNEQGWVPSSEAYPEEHNDLGRRLHLYPPPEGQELMVDQAKKIVIDLKTKANTLNANWDQSGRGSGSHQEEARQSANAALIDGEDSGNDVMADIQHITKKRGEFLGGSGTRVLYFHTHATECSIVKEVLSKLGKKNSANNEHCNATGLCMQRQCCRANRGAAGATDVGPISCDDASECIIKFIKRSFTGHELEDLRQERHDATEHAQHMKQNHLNLGFYLLDAQKRGTSEVLIRHVQEAKADAEERAAEAEAYCLTMVERLRRMEVTAAQQEGVGLAARRGSDGFDEERQGEGDGNAQGSDSGGDEDGDVTLLDEEGDGDDVFSGGEEGDSVLSTEGERHGREEVAERKLMPPVNAGDTLDDVEIRDLMEEEHKDGWCL